jgi:hypothetical protein
MDGIYSPPILLYIIISPINQSDAGHHLSLLATWSSFRIDDWGHLFAVPTMLTELTAPFINTRVYLNHFNLESTTIFKVNGALAIVSWYYLRQWIYCTILALRIFEMRALIFFGDHVLRNSLVCVCFLFGVYLQCFWCFLITKGAISVITGGGGGGGGGDKEKQKKSKSK